MTDNYKEALQKILDAKKEKSNKQGFDKWGASESSGEKRAGVKKYKKGGLFDK